MAHRGWKRDGFTPAKKAEAIEALGKYGNVADAARIAGVSGTTFYRHLNKNPAFARLCDLARAKAAQPLETLAWQRATEGAPETVIRKGEVVQIGEAVGRADAAASAGVQPEEIRAAVARRGDPAADREGAAQADRGGGPGGDGGENARAAARREDGVRGDLEAEQAAQVEALRRTEEGGEGTRAA